MDKLSLVGKRVRIFTYSLGDDWHLGTIVKALILSDCESVVYEFVYDDGPSICIMSDQIAAFEVMTNEEKKFKLLNFDEKK